MKSFSLKKMLGLLAIGGAVAYARSRKIDVLGALGLKKDAAPEDTSATRAQPAPAQGFGNAGATTRSAYGTENRGYSGFNPSNTNRNGTSH